MEDWAQRSKEERKSRRVTRFSPSPIQGLWFKKEVLKFGGGDGSEDQPFVELGLLSKGVQFKGLVVLGSGLDSGLRTLAMVMALLSPLVSLEDLN